MTKVSKKWTAIILAGQRPGIDPLAAHFGEDFKALVPIAGAPMMTRVAETLCAVEAIGRIIIVAQSPDVLRHAVPDDPRIGWFASGSGISSSILALLDSADEPDWPVLVATADHPLLTVDMVESFFAGADAGDLAVGMVESQVLLAAYPENKRTWLKFRDGWWSGANLFALRSAKTRAALELWAEAEQDRKKVWKLFLHFGPWLALRALTRTVGMAHGLQLAGKRLGLDAKLVALPQAEAAIDVDKPSDHALASAILEKRKGELL